MARLIDADKFLSSMIKRFKCVPLIGRNDYDCESLKQMLIEAPTVDAVEVVHGRWECTYDENMGETDVTCSHCKDLRTIIGCYVTSAGESCYFDDNYCPNCGAKMDLEE